MRHLVEGDRRSHTPVPDFKYHSKLLMVMIVVSHPFVAIYSLKVADFVSKIVSEFSSGLAIIYTQTNTLDEPTKVDAEPSHLLYPTVYAVILIILALHSGMFKVFRVNSFWLNFSLSLFLLVLSVFVFSGGNIAQLFV